jgi:hypothetical protein
MNDIVKVGLVLAAALGLSGCDGPARTADPIAEARMKNGEVALVAVAPDGTQLWGITPPGANRRVYFASTGTQTSHTEHCGKSCNRTVDDIVPTAVDPIDIASWKESHP